MGNAIRTKKCFGHGHIDQGDQVDHGSNKKEASKLKIRSLSIESNNHKWAKLLLLGGSESGKTTFANQLRHLYGHGFTESEFINYGYVIQLNAITSLHLILRAIVDLEISQNDMDLEDLQKFELLFENSQARKNDQITPEDTASLVRLWSSASAQLCYDQRHQFELMDSAKYFLDNLDRIFTPGYTPTVADILKSSQPTVDAQQHDLELGSHAFRLFDVGGVQNERRKWANCFNDVSAILFVCSMSEYDQYLADDRLTNRLHDSLSLFSFVISNARFANSSILLLLNKKDVLLEKITTCPLDNCFPGYSGGNTYEEASAYILDQFLQRKRASQSFFHHFTTAIDTTEIEIVFASATKMFLNNNLAKSHLL